MKHFYDFRYLFNPFSILVCLAKSSALFQTVAVLAAIHFGLRLHRRRSMAFLALATLLSWYPLSLFVPLSMILAEGLGRARRTILAALWNYFSFFVLWTGSSWYLSTIPLPTTGSLLKPFTDFALYATPLGCNCTVSDLRPNLGLAWYLFVEMFDHFRAFFLAVFQLNNFILIAPAALKFRNDPVMLLAFLIAVQSIFKPYPTLADSALLLSALDWPGLSIVRHSVIRPAFYVAMFTFSLLGPINWNLWIDRGSGNANFFYAITLFYNVSHIVLVLDLVYQWLKREIVRLNPGVDLSTMYQN